MSRILEKKTIKECKECGDEFKVTNENNKKIFCCLQCKERYHNHEKQEKLKIKSIICTQCGYENKLKGRLSG